MPKLNSLHIASNSVWAYFNSVQQKAYTDYTLRRVVNQNKGSWGISKSTTTKAFLKYYLENGLFQKKELKSDDGSIKLVYIVSGFDNLTAFTALKKNAYFTHFTAMHLNGISLQIPKVHYLNYEHSKDFDKGLLNQESIDIAFNKPQRTSSNSYSFGGNKVFLINGKRVQRTGVIQRINENQSFEYTDLERTLIDIAIRPVYSGGVFEVLNAYAAAKQNINIIKLKLYLDNLNYTYPYHQVIGFYLDKAGYDNSVLEYFTQQIEYSFYLTYDIRKKEFNEKWKIYHPPGF
jgi:hypothetical protein